MHLERLCLMDIHYLEGCHPKPYGNDSGPGWGIGEGTVSGERLGGTFKWSNHSSHRPDSVALPDIRGVITTVDGSEVLVCLTGRAIWRAQGDEHVAHLLLMALFESGSDGYSWLNNEVCMAEGVLDPQTSVFHLEVHRCQNEVGIG
jgi:hypothetical protein